MQISDVKNLGLLMRRVRKEQKLTQEQLAAVSGVGVRFIRELEQGKETCYMGKAFFVLSMLGVIIEVHHK